MKSAARVVLSGVLLTAACSLGGCWVALAAGAAAGVGTYAYVTGDLKGSEPAPIDRVFAASQSAVRSLGFTPGRESKDALTAELRAEQADGTTVRIDLERTGEQVTEIRIRVGTFGDEARSLAIRDKIREHL